MKSEKIVVKNWHLAGYNVWWQLVSTLWALKKLDIFSHIASRYRDPQLKAGKKYLHVFNLRQKNCSACCFLYILFRMIIWTNKDCLTNACLMLADRLRRWPNIQPTLGPYIASAGSLIKSSPPSYTRRRSGDSYTNYVLEITFFITCYIHQNNCHFILRQPLSVKLNNLHLRPHLCLATATHNVMWINGHHICLTWDKIYLQNLMFNQTILSQYLRFKGL